MKKPIVFANSIALFAFSIGIAVTAFGQSAAPPIQGVPAKAPRTFKPVNPSAAAIPSPGVTRFTGPTSTQVRLANPNTALAPGVQQTYAESFFPNSQQQVKLQSKVNGKINEYRQTKDEKKKKAVEEEIRKLLSEQFDERLKGPEQRIDSSRKRLDELKKQVKSRSENQKEIIDLRVKVLTNEAVGLGWASGKSNHNPFITTYPSGFNSVPSPNVYSYNNQWRQSTPSYPPARAPVAGASGWLPNQPTLMPQPTKAGAAQAKDDKPSVGQLLNDFKSAKEKQERDRIIKELRSLLEDEFKNHQKQLSHSADRIEKMISDLESNLNERKKMKDSIVDLKLKTVINQANGLGF